MVCIWKKRPAGKDFRPDDTASGERAVLKSRLFYGRKSQNTPE
jgi:hypothetical protein